MSILVGESGKPEGAYKLKYLTGMVGAAPYLVSTLKHLKRRCLKSSGPNNKLVGRVDLL